MIPDLRSEFNRQWKPELYGELLRKLNEAAGTEVTFRVCETPVFLPRPLLDRMVRYGRELYAQLAGNRAYLDASRQAVPERFRAPNGNQHPLFLQADFGLVRSATGELEPKLVEIQAFPSIYAFQIAMAHEFERVYGLCQRNPGLSTFLGGLHDASFRESLTKAILNGHDPEQVVLLEIDPYQQKTLPDFLVTQKLLGLKIADIREVKKRGRKLYLKDVEIKRIYNRVIADELIRKNITSEFQFTDDVAVEWAGHPNWFFQISKFSLPWLKHESVPESWFLSDLPEFPANLDDYVLKPLYSFAGLGVKIGPTADEIRAIPGELRREYILQRKMEFIPTIDTPSGPTKVEIRIMYVWDGEMKPITTLLRMGRGKMMGVDFNRDMDWIGASAGFSFAE